MLSKSFTNRLMTSPMGRPSKNESGRRSSFAYTSLRSAYTVFWATPAIMYCCR